MSRNRQRNRNRRRWFGLLGRLDADGLLATEREAVADAFDFPGTDGYRLPDPRPWLSYPAPTGIVRAAWAEKPAPETWSVPKEEKMPVVKECGWAPRAAIQLSTNVYAGILALMDAYPSNEWLSYLVADDQGIMVEMVIPEQIGRMASVHVTQAPEASTKIDGVIHSHHSMAALHSSTDDEHLVANHPISIVVAKKDGIVHFHGMRSVTLPCGSVLQSVVPIQIVSPDQRAWLDEVRARIKDAPHMPSTAYAEHWTETFGGAHA